MTGHAKHHVLCPFFPPFSWPPCLPHSSHSIFRLLLLRSPLLRSSAPALLCSSSSSSLFQGGDDHWVNLAFAKEKANDRKEWIENVHGETFVDYNVALMKYSDFFNKEFVLFSQASVTRAIPALMDGFKPSQRKVLFACLKRNLKQEIKVAQLAG
jgi:hypothetical protein